MTHPVTVPLATARAHAKVNLHLGVGAAREDGYHELSTVFQSVSASDVVTLHAEDAPAPGSAGAVTGMRLSSGANPEVPLDAGNLAWRAVDAIVAEYRREHGPRELPGVLIDLHKSIPVAGGMAGGSADAAAALVAADAWLAEEYGVAPRGVDKLLTVGAGLGADVPFTLKGGSALGTDRGDRLTTMMSRGPFHWAMITNARGLSTGAVFAKLDQMRAADPDREALTPHLDTGAVSHAMISGDPHQLGPALHNDLQPATLSLRPDLRKVHDAGMDAGAVSGIISGSGPTWAFLCEDEASAQEVVDQVSADIAAASGMVVSSPDLGAHLLY